MNELIKITEQDGRQAVSARELHQFLESKRQFADWIKNRIKKYGLVENQDYVSFSQSYENGGRLIEYALTLDCAKELAMVEGNAKGKQARQYFIQKEKELRQVQQPKSQIDLIIESALMLRENERRISAVEQKVVELEAQSQTRPDFFTIVGYASLQGIKAGIKLASSLGRKAAKICKDRGIQTETIPDPRFGEVNTYPRGVLEEVFTTPIN